MAGETVERQRRIAAEPAQVWAVVGDVTRMPEWSADLESVDLLEGDGVSAGSRFRGNNRDKTRAWSMTCVIDSYEPGELLAFHTEKDGQTRTRWWYRVQAEGGGSLVTEGFERVAKLNRLRAMAERKLIGDRTEYNQRNIDASLERLAALLES